MQITSFMPGMYVGMAVAALGALGLSGTVVYLARQSGRDTWLVYVAMAPFLLAGLLLAYFGLRGLGRLALFGHWILDVSDRGVVLGQPCTVILRPTRARTPTGEVTCVLTCRQSVRRAGRMEATTLFESQWTQPVATLDPSLGVELRLPLPDAGEPTDVDRRTGAGVQWQLNVHIPSRFMKEEPVFDLAVGSVAESALLKSYVRL